jgi:tripartite-type tricarboxylate transporter receptor subunit TctC
MINVMRACVAMLAVILGLGAAANARAQTYPNRSIQLVVGFAPGSVQDAAARLVSKRAGQLLGAQFVVENKAGAGTMIASDAVAKARPDGYTLLQNGVALCTDVFGASTL